jgi:hypothetical protein
LAPEETRAALALLGARLLRPRGVGIGAVLVTDGQRTGLAVTVRDLRGPRARRRFVIWPDGPRPEVGPALDGRLAAVAARSVAIECLRTELLQGRGRGQQYEALSYGLCGRQYARSAPQFEGYTVGLYRAAVADYVAALETAAARPPWSRSCAGPGAPTHGLARVSILRSEERDRQAAQPAARAFVPAAPADSRPPSGGTLCRIVFVAGFDYHRQNDGGQVVQVALADAFRGPVAVLVLALPVQGGQIVCRRMVSWFPS